RVLGKPDPGILLAAAARRRVPIENCLMAGDRLATDIAVGVNAGAMTCRINGPGADLTPAEGIVPDLEVPDLGKLQDLWEKELF
ncbi:MAG: HAD hydrolase-like protein, partial [Lentisphaeria bacterium]|nr:HAD hydrolase-like protein [Lentisphaeria bacterium]